MKFLIVTADDFGLHPSVNRAVEQAAREGVLSAASLMVGAPAAADAVRRARELPDLSVGLHVVLADGWSVLPQRSIPALVDGQGRFGNNMVRDGVRFFALPAVRRQLEAEIRAQFQAFAATGLPLDHVNAHKHFHLHPTLLEMLLRIGAEFGVPAVRLPREPAWVARRASGAIAGPAIAGLLSPWLAIMRRRLRAARIAHNDYVFGIADSGSMDEARLLEVLGKLPDGVTEIYLHPALESGTAIAPSMAGYRHADELAALLSPKVRAAVAACGADTGGFRRLSTARTTERRAA
ncbi:MAG TPA: hopanoid biosynthesis-associated protein HpnK [Steroidobacteraceae bacterium]|nr:hopanoid biosynthesis-associated protein HpnK [Steroidobacteraceae bacterium]